MSKNTHTKNSHQLNDADDPGVEHDIWCIHHPRNRDALAGLVPAEILQGDRGRWYARGFEVTYVAFWWKCPNGHSYQESIPARIDGARCPNCGA